MTRRNTQEVCVDVGKGRLDARLAVEVMVMLKSGEEKDEGKTMGRSQSGC